MEILKDQFIKIKKLTVSNFETMLSIGVITL